MNSESHLPTKPEDPFSFFSFELIDELLHDTYPRSNTVIPHNLRNLAFFPSPSKGSAINTVSAFWMGTDDVFHLPVSRYSTLFALRKEGLDVFTYWTNNFGCLGEGSGQGDSR